MPLAVEILIELPANLVYGLRRAQDPRSEHPGEPLDLAFGLRVVRDPAKAGAGPGNEQRAERRVDEVVRDVEQALVGRGRAEARVELVGDGHEGPSFLRRRRIPDDAACLAASADDPSAVPISSYSRS